MSKLRAQPRQPNQRRLQALSWQQRGALRKASSVPPHDDKLKAMRSGRPTPSCRFDGRPMECHSACLGQSRHCFIIISVIATSGGARCALSAYCIIPPYSPVRRRPQSFKNSGVITPPSQIKKHCRFTDNVVFLVQPLFPCGAKVARPYCWGWAFYFSVAA